ncbi:MAG: carboxymuconolactone decarboxylase family protein [Dehalococcoidales bacterium]|nr:carboxymuconolactone decarboxylase family protein [Dehalococcoidales bacterium]
MPDKSRALLKKIEKERGNVRPWRAVLAQYDPEFMEKWHAVQMHAVERESALSRKMKEIMCIVCDAVTYYDEGLRLHIRRALEMGVTEAEILDALEVCSLLGVHYVSVNVEPFDEEVKKFKGAKSKAVGMSKDDKEFIDRMLAERGSVLPYRYILTQRDPEFMDKWHNVIVHALMREGALSRKDKEIICVAIDALTYFEAGLRRHVNTALKEGASEQEILDALEICSAAGVHFMSRHLVAFQEVVRDFKK